MFGLRSKPKRPIEAPSDVAGVRVKVSLRARRLSLRLDPKLGGVILVWPRGASERNALRFIEQNRSWIEQHRRKAVAPKTFADGAVIPIYGQSFRIVRKDGRGSARLVDSKYPHPNLLPEGEGTRAVPPPLPLGEGRGEGTIGELVIHCKPEHLHRRVKDFLKETARDILEDIAAKKQDELNLKPKDIRVIDPKTRWGSCSPDGRLMFSWRLILAPPDVLDYLVAHEVAHRVHLNHGRKFWVLCASLTSDMAASRRWLRKYGSGLMAYQ